MRASFFRGKYIEYCKKFGLGKSLHVARDLGPDVSLMTEIVYKNLLPDQSVFPDHEDLDSDFSYDMDEEEKKDTNDVKDQLETP